MWYRFHVRSCCSLNGLTSKKKLAGYQECPWSCQEGLMRSQYQQCREVQRDHKERGYAQRVAFWELRPSSGWWSNHQKWARPNKASRPHAGGSGYRSPTRSCIYLGLLYVKCKALFSCLAGKSYKLLLRYWLIRRHSKLDSIDWLLVLNFP